MTERHLLKCYFIFNLIGNIFSARKKVKPYKRTWKMRRCRNGWTNVWPLMYRSHFCHTGRIDGVKLSLFDDFRSFLFFSYNTCWITFYFSACLKLQRKTNERDHHENHLLIENITTNSNNQLLVWFSEVFAISGSWLSSPSSSSELSDGGIISSTDLSVVFSSSCLSSNSFGLEETFLQSWT